MMSCSSAHLLYDLPSVFRLAFISVVQNKAIFRSAHYLGSTKPGKNHVLVAEF
jgi:hypothetical protein